MSASVASIAPPAAVGSCRFDVGLSAAAPVLAVVSTFTTAPFVFNRLVPVGCGQCGPRRQNRDKAWVCDGRDSAGRSAEGAEAALRGPTSTASRVRARGELLAKRASRTAMAICQTLPRPDPDHYCLGVSSTQSIVWERSPNGRNHFAITSAHFVGLIAAVFAVVVAPQALAASSAPAAVRPMRCGCIQGDLSGFDPRGGRPQHDSRAKRCSHGV